MKFTDNEFANLKEGLFRGCVLHLSNLGCFTREQVKELIQLPQMIINHHENSPKVGDFYDMLQDESDFVDESPPLYPDGAANFLAKRGELPDSTWDLT